MKKLKIGFFMDGFFPETDGVVYVIDNLAKELSKFADVTMVVPYTSTANEDKDRPYKVIRIDSVPIPTTEFRFALTHLKEISVTKELLNEKFDIIHIHSPFMMGKLGIRTARKLNVPVITTTHTRFDFEFKRYFKADKLVKAAMNIVMKTFNKCDSCIALNKSVEKVYRDYGYNGPTYIVNNGTEMKLVEDPQKALDTVNELYNFNKEDRILLFVGRINVVKNLFFIVDVLNKLKQKNFGFKMMFVGSGPDEDKLKDKIKENGLENDVILTGKITDREILKQIYYRADLFVFPSLFDTCSLVQAEAASQGTPTIFIEGAPTADIVTNNENGFTAPNDVEQFANRVIEIFNDNELYKKVCNGAKNELAKSWETIANETYEVYLREIEKKKNKM